MKEKEHITAKTFNKEYPNYFKKFKPNKFNAKKVLLDGKKFDSSSEGDYYAELKLQERAGLIKAIDIHVKEELWAYGGHICDYYVDFKVYHNDGSIEFIEHKSEGTVTPAWRIKWKMLEEKYRNDKNVKCSVNWYKGFKTIRK